MSEADLHIAWSNCGANYLKETYPSLQNGNIEILHPGIDLDRWPFRSSVASADQFRLLFVAGDLVRKGVDTLLDAFEESLQKTCQLSIVTQSASLSPELRARIQRLPGVELYCDLTPMQEELQALYRKSDCLVLPTNIDQSPWVVLEALAMGIPVIVTPIGGIPDMVQHERTGLLIPPRDPAALAAAVDRLRESQVLCAQLSAAGRAHIEEHFDASKNTQRLLNLLTDMVDQRRGLK